MRRCPIAPRKTQDVVTGRRKHPGDAAAEPFGGSREKENWTSEPAHDVDACSWWPRGECCRVQTDGGAVCQAERWPVLTQTRQPFAPVLARSVAAAGSRSHD